MRIFDGVETNPTPQQQPSRGQKWLTALMFLLNAFVAAEQCRQERVAAESEELGTFEQVMAQAGLKIPTLEHALAQLMGNAEQAKIAASMIAGSSDPIEVLQRFVRRFAADATDPAGTPDTPGSPTSPRAAGTSESPSPKAAGSSEPPAGAATTSAPTAEMLWERPDFETLAREAVRGADAAGGAQPEPEDRGPLLWERPEFERLAREAVRAADAAAATGAPPPPPLPTYWKDYVRMVANDSPRPNVRPDSAGVGTPATPLPSPAAPRPALAGVVKRQLEALRRRMDAYEAELDLRLVRAEAELAALRDDLRRRSRPTLVVVPRPSDEVPAEGPARDDGAVEADAEEPQDLALADAPRLEPSLEVEDTATPCDTPETQPPMGTRGVEKPTQGAAAQPSAPAAEQPPAASDEDFAEALDLLAELHTEVDARYQRDLARVRAVEQEAEFLRAEVREATEPAVDDARS